MRFPAQSPDLKPIKDYLDKLNQHNLYGELSLKTVPNISTTLVDELEQIPLKKLVESFPGDLYRSRLSTLC